MSIQNRKLIIIAFIIMNTLCLIISFGLVLFVKNLNDDVIEISNRLEEIKENSIIENKINRVKSLELELAKAKDKGPVVCFELEKLLISEKQELEEYLSQQNLKNKHVVEEVNDVTSSSEEYNKTTSVHNYNLICPKCNMEGFQDLGGLIDHMIVKHSYRSIMDSYGNYICPYCEWCYNGKQYDLLKHIRENHCH